MQPPSLKPPEFRRTQIHRQYTSMLRSTPMMIFFQHTNLKSNEWVAVRRELAVALRKVDESSKAKGYTDLDLADSIKIQVIQTGVFGAALRVVEYYETEPLKVINALDTAVPTSSELPPSGSPSQAFAIPHALSRSAYEAVEKKKLGQALAPLIVGQLAVLTFPTVSAEHLKAAMSILSPQAPNFPAPKRRTDPGYHDPSVQAGVQKLLLLGARVEGKVFDTEGARWVGSIEGGIDGLRGQLAAMLQSLGAGVTNTLETAGRSLYFTMESRRTMLDEEKGKTETETETDRASDQKQ
ncbi:MAG: hypothetical protein LQ340_003710 [Diploschistes diacapsis]|nr:MAG: hypothetical protein LQ340_003710 [Diploschistes diacapsis]